MKVTLKIWRQKNPNEKGAFVNYPVDNVDDEMSILECLDVLNESLILRGELPVAFEHDCREGICGSCGFVINGIPHGPERATTACQLTMRHFKDGETITLEPWRAKAFPTVKDLVVNRRALDHIIEAGGYISVSTGQGPEANGIPISKAIADQSMDAAACIGCGACVAACPNASAALFTGAKITHLGTLPQGDAERDRRALSMVAQMTVEGFGNCTSIGECTAACPKEISLDVIARMNGDFLCGSIKRKEDLPIPVAPVVQGS